jgi:GNAT superfamily N-acetyltransferase
MLAKFTLEEQSTLLPAALEGVEVPAGVSIRPVAFDTDIKRITDLVLDFGVDVINPAYGMAPETEPGELCLIAERDDRLVGQISCKIEALGRTQTNIDLWVTGVFVSAHARREGIGQALGQAAIGFCETWRRQVARDHDRNAYGSINVSADTEPDSAGNALIMQLEQICLDLEDRAFEDIPGEGDLQP